MQLVYAVFCSGGRCNVLGLQVAGNCRPIINPGVKDHVKDDAKCGAEAGDVAGVCFEREGLPTARNRQHAAGSTDVKPVQYGIRHCRMREGGLVTFTFPVFEIDGKFAIARILP
jgi:hypothetical protein